MSSIKKKEIKKKEMQNKLYEFCASRKRGCKDCLFENQNCVDFLKPNFDIEKVSEMYSSLKEWYSKNRGWRMVASYGI